MRPVFSAAKRLPGRVVYAEGEDERVLRAAQIVVDEGLALPILLGRPRLVAERCRALGLRMEPGRDFSCRDPAELGVHESLADDYCRLMAAHDAPGTQALAALRTTATAYGAMLVRRGEADAMLCGIEGAYHTHLQHIRQVIDRRDGVETLAAMNALMLPERTVFVCDTYVNPEPTAAQIANIALLAAEEVRRFGLEAHVALISHSSYGSADTASARKMRAALAALRQRAPELEVDGEMQGDAALSRRVLDQVRPGGRRGGDPNLLVMPNLDAANISFNMLKTAAGGGITIGPILLGVARAVHILTPTASVRRVVNMTALAVADAHSHRPLPAAEAKP